MKLSTGTCCNCCVATVQLPKNIETTICKYVESILQRSLTEQQGTYARNDAVLLGRRFPLTHVTCFVKTGLRSACRSKCFTKSEVSQYPVVPKASTFNSLPLHTRSVLVADAFHLAGLNSEPKVEPTRPEITYTKMIEMRGHNFFDKIVFQCLSKNGLKCEATSSLGQNNAKMD